MAGFNCSHIKVKKNRSLLAIVPDTEDFLDI